MDIKIIIKYLLFNILFIFILFGYKIFIYCYNNKCKSKITVNEPDYISDKYIINVSSIKK